MNGSRFATLNIRAPSMHGLQVSERELRHRRWPDGDLSVGYMQLFLRLCVLLALVLLQSYCPSHQCSIFCINNYNPLLLMPFLLDSMALILAASQGPQHSFYHLWQSQVKIEHYSIAYFAHVTVFEAL